MSACVENRNKVVSFFHFKYLFSLETAIITTKLELDIINVKLEYEANRI
jgi:hypothetical protein